MTTNIPRRARHPALWIALFGLAAAWSCADNRPGGAGTTPPADTPVAVPTQFVVAVDLSTSLTAAERASHEALLHALANELDFGERLVLLEANASGVRNSAPPRAVSVLMPPGSKPLKKHEQARDLARQSAEHHVTSLFRNTAVIGSDLLTTLHTAGDLIGQGGGSRTVLVLLSDMLHCADGVCIEEPHPIPDSAWIAARKANGLLRSLNNVCVVVVGADASNERGVRVREFWRRYFKDAGAIFSEARYVHRALSPEMLRCQD